MSALCSAALCSVDMLQGACAVNTCVFVCLGIAQCGGRVETRCLQKKEKECNPRDGFNISFLIFDSLALDYSVLNDQQLCPLVQHISKSV